MKYAISFLLLTASIAVNSAAVADESRTVQIEISDAVIPTGLTSSSNAYVTEIMMLNGCSQWAYAHVTYASGNIIEIESFVTVKSGICPMYVLRVHEQVPLGELAAGEYTIRFMNPDGTYFEEPMTIQ